MVNIANDNALRLMYSIMGDVKPENIRGIKEAIRSYHRKQVITQENKKKVYADGDTYYTELIPVPYGAEIYKEEWFDNEIRREYIPSQYDCTGQRFTINHRFVKFRGRLYCIHHVAIDV